MPPPDPEAAREAVADVLSDDRFNWTKESKVPNWLQRVFGWISDFFEWIFGNVSPSGRRPPTVNSAGIGLVGQVVMVVVVVAALGLLWWAVSRWRERSKDRKERKKGADVEVGDAPDVSEFTDRTEAEWAAEAEAAAAAGADANAIRAHYGRAVVAVIRAGWAGDNPGRTTGELARDVQATSPQHASSFTSLTRIFEDSWFGHRPVDRSVVQQMASLVDGMVSSAGTGSTERVAVSVGDSR